ncbi:MAG: diacylglycerol kinase family lipid kinase [Chloroflexi bacterium]|nr:diacylglycerol kinase family lipid kinase [Chloroflexota bacterium]
MHRSQDRWTIIANGRAGRGRALARATSLSSRLDAQGTEADVRATDAPGAAARLAREAVEAGSTRIVASGGDGTVHEVVNGIMAAPASSRQELELGILPAGRCNDLAHALGLPAGPDAAITGLLHHRTQTLDLGHVVGSDPVSQERGSAYFITVATFGFDSEVAEFVADGRAPAILGASGAYLYGAAVTLRTYAWPDATVRGDFGAFRGQLLLAAVGNTSRYGGRIRVAPDARPDDGRLDLCLVRRMPKWEILRMLPRALAGSHVGHPAVAYHRIRQVQLAANRKVGVWADGEFVAHPPVTITVVPQALRVMRPDR